MNINYKSLRRPTAALMALALLVGSAAPSFLSAKTVLAAQVTSRSIQMSDSGPSDGTVTSGVGSGTAVKYVLKFTTVGAMQSFVVDFCSASPLISDTCTAPTGFATGSATLTANGTWSLTPSASQWKMTNTSSQAAGAFTFEFNGITNPSTTGPFYARVTTYADATYGTYSSATSVGNYVDYGGIALSTTAPIKITARVMESLTLCTSSAAYSGLSCAGAAAPTVYIGNGGPTNVLDTSSVYTTPIYSQISTNALNGYALYLRASNSCGGLSRDGGTTCGIPAVDGGSAAGTTITAGTAAFGATVSDGTAQSGGTGTNTAVARWKTTAPTYIMDTTTSNDNVTYTYGSKIAESSAQANSVNNTITFAATASLTTPAGIYTENFSLIGVGTF